MTTTTQPLTNSDLETPAIPMKCFCGKDSSPPPYSQVPKIAPECNIVYITQTDTHSIPKTTATNQGDVVLARVLVACLLFLVVLVNIYNWIKSNLFYSYLGILIKFCLDWFNMGCSCVSKVCTWRFVAIKESGAPWIAAPELKNRPQSIYFWIILFFVLDINTDQERV